MITQNEIMWQVAEEVLRLTADHDCCEMVWWRTDDQYAPVTFLVNVNDQFGPMADAEAITPENVEIFRKALEDCAELDRKHPPSTKDIGNQTDGYAITRADVLFVSRVRKQRIWKRKLKNYPVKMHALLLTAGESGQGWDVVQPGKGDDEET